MNPAFHLLDDLACFDLNRGSLADSETSSLFMPLYIPLASLVSAAL